MKRILCLALLALMSLGNPASAQTLADSQSNQVVVLTPTAEQTRDDFWKILRKYPYTVGEIIRRDPTLVGNADFMAPYPDLASFMKAHPEIPKNVEFYLEGYGSWGRQPMDPTYEALAVLLGGLAGGFILLLFSGVIIWLVRAFIQHRRWLKASTVQAEVHTKLMDRMTSNEELLTYVQSPAGRRFLEAAPMRPEAEGASFSAPVGSIIWSMMAGIVLATLGAGFRYAGGAFVKDDGRDAFLVVGVLILSLGIGFIFASMMAFAVSSRLGLFPSKKAIVESQSTNA